MKTLFLEKKHLDLESLPKDIRHEVSRGQREKLYFREATPNDHNERLREYRKRKGLLMPPFGLKDTRTYYGVYLAQGQYCCSLALFSNCEGYLVIQGVSIAEDCPYYAFSFLIYKCLELALSQNYKGLDLAGEGEWKKKWNPIEGENGLSEPKHFLGGLFGGRINRVLAKIYWFFKR